MKFKEYSVTIPEGNEMGEQGDSAYVSLAHGQNYSIIIGNHRRDDRRCVVEISIDGELIQGCPIIESGGSFILEKANSGKKLAFYQSQSGSEDAIKSGVSAGEIIVAFYAEYEDRLTGQFEYFFATRTDIKLRLIHQEDLFPLISCG